MRSGLRQVLGIGRFIWFHPANRGRRVRALARTVAWQAYKRATGRHWDLRVFGMRLRCYPDSTSASLALYCHGYPDYHEMKFMQDYLRPGDGFVDVGANVGVYTLAAASLVRREGRIDALEPDRRAGVRLRENLGLNGLTQVVVHDVAAGARPETVRFLSGRDTMNRIGTARDAAPTVEVACVRLDDLLAGRSYAMGKMDIEGAEPLALQGAQRMLGESNPPVWLLEMNGLLRDLGFTEEGLAEWLRERGYDLAVYDADARDLKFFVKPWTGRSNVLAISRPSRDFVLERLTARPRRDLR